MSSLNTESYNLFAHKSNRNRNNNLDTLDAFSRRYAIAMFKWSWTLSYRYSVTKFSIFHGFNPSGSAVNILKYFRIYNFEDILVLYSISRIYFHVQKPRFVIDTAESTYMSCTCFSWSWCQCCWGPPCTARQALLATSASAWTYVTKPKFIL